MPLALCTALWIAATSIRLCATEALLAHHHIHTARAPRETRSPHRHIAAPRHIAASRPHGRKPQAARPLQGQGHEGIGAPATW